MKDRIIAIIVPVLLLTMMSVEAQTVVWELEPSNYSDIEQIGPDLFKAVRNGKVGLITSNGTVIAAVENDALSDFYEGYAVMTKAESVGERVMGVLSEDGRYTPFADRYYTLSGQKFYSDGVLTVADSTGKKGYIDLYGQVVNGFNGRYDRIKPYVDGYAVVSRNKRYYLIDKSGSPVHLTIDGVGEIYGITNPYKGVVYLWDTDGQFYTYDVRKGGLCLRTRLPDADKTFDYLFRFCSVSRQGKSVPFKKLNYQGTPGPHPSIIGGLYGYSSDGGAVVLPQFSTATQFKDGLAVVTVGGKPGIIRYVSGEAFKFDPDNARELVYRNGGSVSCHFGLTVPSAWRGKNLNVQVKDDMGKSMPSTYESGGYTFKYPPHSSSERFMVSVSADGLKLAETALTYSFKRKAVCAVCGRDKDKCPGHFVPPSGQVPPKVEKTCPTCGKKISECKYQGVH